MSARDTKIFPGVLAALLLGALVVGDFCVQAQEIPEALLKELEAVSQRQGEAFIEGVRELSGRSAETAALLKGVFLKGQQNWRVRLTAGSVAGWIDGRTNLESVFGRIEEIRKTHNAEPAEEAEPEKNDPEIEQGAMDVDVSEGTFAVLGLSGHGQSYGNQAMGRNRWLNGLPTPIKDLTSDEARIALMVMVATSPRPVPKTDEYRWDELSLAVAFRALTGLTPDGLLDDLVLDELKKVPLLKAHRIWALEYVEARRLQSAVSIIRDSTVAWKDTEGTNWPERGGRSLAKIGGRDAEECLIKWSISEDENYRIAGANGLSLLGSARAKTRLQYMSNDPKEPIRDFAKMMLEDLTSTERK